MPIHSYGPILVATSWGHSCAVAVFGALRFYSKRRRRLDLWWDDYILIAAWLCLVVVSIIATYMVRFGYGQHAARLDAEALARASSWTAPVTTTAILAVAWSKTSFAVTLLRLAAPGWARAFLWFLIASLNAALLLNPVLTALPFVGMPALTGYGTFSGLYSAAVDFTLAILPWAVILNMQMNTKEKIGVAVAMSMGIFAGTAAIIKTILLEQADAGGFVDFTYSAAQVLTWATAEAGVTCICASVPFLRALVRDCTASPQDPEPAREGGAFPKHEIAIRRSLSIDWGDASDAGDAKSLQNSSKFDKEEE